MWLSSELSEKQSDDILLTPFQSIRSVYDSHWVDTLNGFQVHIPRNVFHIFTRYSIFIFLNRICLESSVYSFVRRVVQQCLRLPGLFLESQVYWNIPKHVILFLAWQCPFSDVRRVFLGGFFEVFLFLTSFFKTYQYKNHLLRTFEFFKWNRSGHPCYPT